MIFYIPVFAAISLSLSRHQLCHDAMVMLMDVVEASPSLNVLRLDSVRDHVKKKKTGRLRGVNKRRE
jgi:hypothetical protein